MKEAEQLSPALRQVYEYMLEHQCERLSAGDVAKDLDLSYSSAYYRLRRLAKLELINEHLAWIIRPRIRRRWFHLPFRFFKSHIIISMDYAETHLFEIHIIFPHLKQELTEEDRKVLTALAFELLIDYGIPENLLTNPYTVFNLGEVQTKPVARFNEKTEASIFDVKTSGHPVRTSYAITWQHKKAWIETTLTGERIEHPETVTYTQFEAIGTIGREELKEKWLRLAEEEAVQ